MAPRSTRQDKATVSILHPALPHKKLFGCFLRLFFVQYKRETVPDDSYVVLLLDFLGGEVAVPNAHHLKRKISSRMRMEKEDLTQIRLEWKPSISLYGCGGTSIFFEFRLWQKEGWASGKCVNQKTFLLQSIFSWEQNEKDCSSNLRSPSRENAHFFLLGVAWVGYWGTPSVPRFLLSGGGGAHYSREAEEEEAMPSMNSKFVFLPLLLCMQKSSNLQFVTLRRIKAMVGMCRHPARSSIRPEHS